MGAGPPIARGLALDRCRRLHAASQRGRPHSGSRGCGVREATLAARGQGVNSLSELSLPARLRSCGGVHCAPSRARLEDARPHPRWEGPDTTRDLSRWDPSRGQDRSQLLPNGSPPASAPGARLPTLHAVPRTDPGIRVAELGASVRGTPICQRGIRILLLTGSLRMRLLRNGHDVRTDVEDRGSSRRRSRRHQPGSWFVSQTRR